jgi:hypothetical protein
MTASRIYTKSVLTKALSAAFVLTALVATPLQAHEYRTIDRHAEQSVSRGERGSWMAMPARSTLASQPQPGGVCDAGDDPMIC